ncbi:MAG: GntR family transcriptional regulator [Candidatus Aerophobetes bacterium]|nr:GntR family transcriptional regulator [Candidatus Aerophobetes bacterium]
MGKTDDLPIFEQPSTIASAVSRYLEDAILKGKIKSGTRLIERELAEKFKVSRLPIREAIRELQAAGLVKIISRKGAVVSQISLKEIKEIYAVKCLIESFAAGEAAKRVTKGEIKELKMLIDKMSSQIKKNNSHKYTEIAEKFHYIINKASGNSKLYEIYKRLNNQVLWHKINYLSSPGRVERSFEGHKKILEALINKDTKQAESLMKKHIKDSEKALLERLGADKSN